MDQILIRNLPAGTKAALRSRAKRHRRSVEAEARALLTDALALDPPSLVDLLASDHIEVEFEPERLGLKARTPEL